ncbi:hypothetical protein LCGC14_0164110 [marine sediment metagenome]|uniref:Uncharacterized protein n=1 Tax=marine sediment metagenome TaxID=412755 RepID=A0A0F9VAK1_9ZZZZ
MSDTVVDLVASFKYFNVHGWPRKKHRKTRDYTVVCKKGSTLGEIVFYSNWRQHVLVPTSGTVWSKGCLANVNEFIEGIGRKWR